VDLSFHPEHGGPRAAKDCQGNHRLAKKYAGHIRGAPRCGVQKFHATEMGIAEQSLWETPNK
jgi:hypothetical protein